MSNETEPLTCAGCGWTDDGVEYLRGSGDDLPYCAVCWQLSNRRDRVVGAVAYCANLILEKLGSTQGAMKPDPPEVTEEMLAKVKADADRGQPFEIPASVVRALVDEINELQNELADAIESLCMEKNRNA